jgi:hypothetical protein
VEALNVFNHVNLGQPDGNLGIPGNPNLNAGRITETAATYIPREVLFGLRFAF